MPAFSQARSFRKVLTFVDVLTNVRASMNVDL